MINEKYYEVEVSNFDSYLNHEHGFKDLPEFDFCGHSW